MKTNKNSIIKDSKTIHSFILKRIKELELTPASIIKDAEGFGRKIEAASLSKYINHGNINGALSEDNIIWLSTRWGVDITLMVGTPTLVDGKLKINLPEYNEKKALAKLKTIFG